MRHDGLDILLRGSYVEQAHSGTNTDHTITHRIVRQWHMGAGLVHLRPCFDALEYTTLPLERQPMQAAVLKQSLPLQPFSVEPKVLDSIDHVHCHNAVLQ